MNNTYTLLILAAGMGSRYGGLKQLDELGPNGETIMDYSVNDAIAAGFNKVVFVIRKDFKALFETHILSKYQDKIECVMVFQELDLLPEGYTPNPNRQKPYGTGHAIWAAKEVINEPFVVINADDFYGQEAYTTMIDFFKNGKDDNAQFSMVGYQLQNTLSEHGSVSRGVCNMSEDGLLTKVTEMTHIVKENNEIKNKLPNGESIPLSGNDVVSMNFWGFQPVLFEQITKLFVTFLQNNNENIKAEFPIPDVVTHCIENGIASVKVLHCAAQWFGVTYQDDKPIIMKKLKEL